MVGKHFSEDECACRCGCGQMNVSPMLVGLLEAIRARFMKPVTVYSWNRCPDWNAQVGGVDNSFHCQGLAADISISGVELDRITEEARRVGADGVGIYYDQGFVHVDVRGWKYEWID